LFCGGVKRIFWEMWDYFPVIQEEGGIIMESKSTKMTLIYVKIVDLWG